MLNHYAQDVGSSTKDVESTREFSTFQFVHYFVFRI